MFLSFTHETAKYFVQKYLWYCMLPTLLKFLLHGSEIIENAILSIGELFGEAQETRNKDLK